MESRGHEKRAVVRQVLEGEKPPYVPWSMGFTCFNPLQPEVMDVWTLLPRYRGRLAFRGGLSTQRTLPHGTPDEVRDETRRLLELGREGGYVFAPAHAVGGDVPLENILAAIEVVQAQESGVRA